jgi:hypothetical protein
MPLNNKKTNGCNASGAEKAFYPFRFTADSNEAMRLKISLLKGSSIVLTAGTLEKVCLSQMDDDKVS